VFSAENVLITVECEEVLEMTLCWASTNWRMISREMLNFSLSIAVVMVTTLHNACAARGRPADVPSIPLCLTKRLLPSSILVATGMI
jgi:hypothetical protein